MVDVIQVIERFYTVDSPLYDLLVKHSRGVADRALAIADKSGLVCDRDFVYEAAMLHDIGICRTYAPTIHCYGDSKYICHGVIGAEMLRELGLEAHALVCERHTGSGLTANDIRLQGLPIPIRDMLPISIEERLICYADNFLSKSTPNKQLSHQDVERKLAKFGDDVLLRFRKLRDFFGE